MDKKIIYLLEIIYIILRLHQIKCQSCKGRKILQGNSGIITDGIEKYQDKNHCEFLINGLYIFNINNCFKNQLLVINSKKALNCLLSLVFSI